MSSSRKPAIVRKFTRDWCAGFASSSPTNEIDELELLDTSGKLMRIPWGVIKWVCYVREFASGTVASTGSGSEAGSPERLLRRRFTSRPRAAGLWLRLTLSDGDELEGVAANDRSLVEGAGLLLTPPDTRSNTQRIFVPRSSIREMAVLAVISSAVAGRGRGERGSELQPELFPSE